MATVLDSVGDYLAANGHGTLGSTLFLSVMPETPDAMVAVYESVGGTPSFTMGSAATAIDRPVIQVICRGVRGDYPGPRDKAQAIRALLGAVTDQTLSGIRVMRLSPQGALNPLGDDENLRPRVSVNFECMVLP